MIVGVAVGLFWCACFFLIVECCCLLVIAILCEFVGFGWCGAFAYGGLHDIGLLVWVTCYLMLVVLGLWCLTFCGDWLGMVG